jgi:hypothetical protein
MNIPAPFSPYMIGPAEVVISAWHPAQRVRAANMMAAAWAQVRPVRELAGVITERAENMPMEAPALIVAWIRNNVRYQQEEREVLQGPMTTLPPMTIGPVQTTGRGAGDCDDLSILAAALMRACGLKAYVVGVCQPGREWAPYHAIAWCQGQAWETTDNRYHPAGTPQLSMAAALPPDAVFVWYNPDIGRYQTGRYVSTGTTPDRQMAGFEDAVGAMESLPLDMLPGPARQVMQRGMQAAGTAAAVASQASSLAATLGLSAAAVPVVGWIVGGAALLGIGIGAMVKAGKARRETAREALNVREWMRTLVRVFGLQPGEDASLVLMRLQELIPRMAGTGVPVATYDDQRSLPGLRWADGSDGPKAGVLRHFRNKVKDQGAALEAHAGVAQSLAQSMASVPLLQRRQALRLALEQFLPGGMAGMEWLPALPEASTEEGSGAREQKRGVSPWLLVAAAAAAAAFLA